MHSFTWLFLARLYAHFKEIWQVSDNLCGWVPVVVGRWCECGLLEGSGGEGVVWECGMGVRVRVCGCVRVGGWVVGDFSEFMLFIPNPTHSPQPSGKKSSDTKTLISTQKSHVWAQISRNSTTRLKLVKSLSERFILREVVMKSVPELQIVRRNYVNGQHNTFHFLRESNFKHL